MKIFVKRFIYALIIFFFTAQLLTGIILIYGKKTASYYHEDALGGLFFLFLFYAYLFRHKIKSIMANAWFLVFPMGVMLILLEAKSPISNYVAIRHEVNIGIIDLDEIYHINSEKFRKIELKKLNLEKDGINLNIGRNFYSANSGVLQGLHLGVGSELVRDRLLYRGAFGMITACEMFFFISINMIPVMLVYSLCCHWKSKPPISSKNIRYVDALMILVPIIIGSVPLWAVSN